MTRMTPSEAFVETLASHGVTDIFGIVGSAYMDALDIFPAAGIRFIPTVHEQGSAHMADGYSRVSGRPGVCIAQNGPGITNFVTAIAAAYWAHSPVVAITPETGSTTMGLGGFQETDQLPIFSKITKYQGHVSGPDRLAEITGRCFDMALSERGPTQLNIPRDHFYGEVDVDIPKPTHVERAADGIWRLRGTKKKFLPAIMCSPASSASPSKIPCQQGAVHTWPRSEVPTMSSARPVWPQLPTFHQRPRFLGQWLPLYPGSGHGRHTRRASQFDPRCTFI